MRAAQPSKADRELLEVLRRRGCSTSATQIERWRYWRRGGLIPRPSRHGLGRGTTSTYSDLDLTASRVQEVDELRGRYRGLDEIALVLAARGRPLDPVSVKAALLQVINGIERSFRSHAKDVDDPFEIAYSATSALTRAWRNDRGSRRGTGSVLPRPLLEIGGRLLIGDPVASHQLREFLGGGSLAPLLSALDLSVEPLADHLAAHAARFSFPAIRATVEQTNPDAVIAALLTASGTIRAFPLLQAVVPTETAYDVTVIGMSIGFLTAGARTN